MTLSESSIDELRASFLQFAQDSKSSSPLYHSLSLAIAEDLKLLKLAKHCNPNQPGPLLFFAAAHFLLLQGRSHPLANYYPSLEGQKEIDVDVYSLFQGFCLSNKSALIPLLTGRRVQTNEVRRSAFLYPAFSYLCQFFGGEPINLIEIGPSAGLNLNLDEYAYQYGENIHRGDPQSLVKLLCTLKGNTVPALPEDFPVVASRLGLELSPVSIESHDEQLWLQALIWPEHLDRFELMRAAIEVREQQPQTIIAGDVLHTLPEALSAIRNKHPVLVYSSLVLYQLSDQHKQDLKQMLSDAAQDRTLFHISAEWDGVEQLEIICTDYQMGDSIHLANSEAHGRWLQWLVE